MQKRNKRDFHTFKLLRAEVDEAEEEKEPQKIAHELADIVLFTMTIANNHEIDLGMEILEKISRDYLKYPAKNFQGDYEYDEAIGKSKSEWKEDRGEEWFYE